MLGCTIGETFKAKKIGSNKVNDPITHKEQEWHTALYKGSGLKGQGGDEQVIMIVLVSFHFCFMD